jgi:hypothetical protein
MQFSLSKKRTAKEAWDAIAAACIGSDHTRTRKTMLQALRKEWEKTLMTLLSVLTLCSGRWCSSETTPATTVARSVDSHDAARLTSHRWRRRNQLCS